MVFWSALAVPLLIGIVVEVPEGRESFPTWLCLDLYNVFGHLGTANTRASTYGEMLSFAGILDGGPGIGW